MAYFGNVVTYCLKLNQKEIDNLSIGARPIMRLMLMKTPLLYGQF